MSLFSTRSITCEKCGNVYTMDEVGSINADRRPDLRQAILDDNFQDAVCPECGHSFRLEPLFTYLDVGRGQWLACYPARQMETYHNEEVAAQEMFDKSYGVDAPKAAQAIGGMLTPRITFGWPAAREKLLLHELGLDDVIVEMTKLDLMRRLRPVSSFVSSATTMTACTSNGSAPKARRCCPAYPSARSCTT